jgi:hypothetical protein
MMMPERHKVGEDGQKRGRRSEGRARSAGGSADANTAAGFGTVLNEAQPTGSDVPNASGPTLDGERCPLGSRGLESNDDRDPTLRRLVHVHLIRATDSSSRMLRYMCVASVPVGLGWFILNRYLQTVQVIIKMLLAADVPLPLSVVITIIGLGGPVIVLFARSIIAPIVRRRPN